MNGGLAWIQQVQRQPDAVHGLRRKRGVEAVRLADVLLALGPDAVLVHDFWGQLGLDMAVVAVRPPSDVDQLGAAALAGGQLPGRTARPRRRLGQR